MENKDTGLLINKQDAELHRGFFEEMVTLLGVIALHRPIKEGMKERDLHGELLDDIYDLPKPVGCIFDEHPNIWTMRKLGWNAERSEDKSIIHVPYNSVYCWQKLNSLKCTECYGFGNLWTQIWKLTIYKLFYI